jgi:hypothetical protein
MFLFRQIEPIARQLIYILLVIVIMVVELTLQVVEPGQEEVVFMPDVFYQ